MNNNSVEVAKISGGGLSATVVSHGAALVDLRIAEHPRSLVLGHDDLNQYHSNEGYLGSIVGRFANRISDAVFFENGNKYQLDCNWLDKHCLHGGGSGTALKEWKIVRHESDAITLNTVDREMETGFPGDCDLTVTYRLPGDGTLEIDIDATPDKRSPCSITAHPYFNLGLTRSISDHMLWIEADHYLPVDAENLPTGKVCPVAGGKFDFRQMRPMAISGEGYDHNFCIAQDRQQLQ
ncbi:MAG: galactose-1-epimerase, partial [Pseudomonadota bacterium]